MVVGMAARSYRIRAIARSLVDDVYDRLKGWVLDEVRAPGTRVNVDAVARDLDVSPTPVREALGRLAAEGVVVKEPPRGWFVTPRLDAAGLRDLFELRDLLEPWAARRAAELATAEQRRALEAELASCPQAPDGDRYAAYRELSEHDQRFHDLLLEHAGNDEVRAAFARTHCHLHLFRLTYGRGMGDEALAEHAAINRAVVAGDGTGAERAMRRHLHRSRLRIEAALPEPG